MSLIEIGCCGAYCKTCKEFHKQICQGCKIGYVDGSRDINKAKCKMKVCCKIRGFTSCADCSDYEKCDIIQNFYKKNGYKYRKYKEATQYIRNFGYTEFLRIANVWKNQYGKYK